MPGANTGVSAVNGASPHDRTASRARRACHSTDRYKVIATLKVEWGVFHADEGGKDSICRIRKLFSSVN